MKNIFLKFRRVWCFVSILLIIGSIAALFIFRMKWGIEFAGGTIMSWRFPESVQTSEIDNLYSAKEVKIEEIVKIEDGSYLVHSEKLADEKTKELSEFIKGGYPEAEKLQVEEVGRMIEKDAFIRIFSSIVFVLFLSAVFVSYSLGNLRKRCSPFVVSFCVFLALIFDLVVTAGIMSLFGKFWGIAFSSSFLTAAFAVLFLSIFSKYLMCQMFKENLLEYKKEDFSNILIKTMNQNMGMIGVILLTVILVLFPVVIFGGENFRWPAAFLLAGIAVSVYSGLFVLNQLILLMGEKVVVKKKR